MLGGWRRGNLNAISWCISVRAVYKGSCRSSEVMIGWVTLITSFISSKIIAISSMPLTLSSINAILVQNFALSS